MSRTKPADLYPWHLSRYLKNKKFLSFEWIGKRKVKRQAGNQLLITEERTVEELIQKNQHGACTQQGKKKVEGKDLRRKICSAHTPSVLCNDWIPVHEN